MISHWDTLHQVKNRLLDHISTLSTYPVFDSKRIREEFDASIVKVNNILRTKTLSIEDKEIIRDINIYTKVLRDILSERIRVQRNSMNTLRIVIKTETKEEELKKEENLESDPSKSKNKRLSKNQLEILEGWFQKNKKHPYSQKDQTDLLMKSTNLSKSQVQNWYVLHFAFEVRDKNTNTLFRISNRRRKEKNAKVSPELAQLLSQ
ncbi:hypothetical protein CTRG_05302 [Candida tropicalis MYA-3404]|uniref:Homeobox domain-containing protein n=1 Tax=Candida tropicalis (strain ATCC MYA-3404 / T1) TaxID=294747 RepID=C5MGU8_CANTT|nr:hypothetical protein CTRG_05302 [Candida tropicalis MYA-3404]EER30850.1 hypothetical protein CTRG_05302 [Candida tropicalis MYA-3404]